MTGQRDIDRTLDAWFVDGPSVMPDRLFDAVLDQVERTPQRPFARLRLRLNDMNPNIRWLTAAAAALVVVLVALATINRPPSDTVGASSTPSASAGASQAGAGPLPSVLRATWMGEPRTVPDGLSNAGVTLTLDAGSSSFLTTKFTGSDFRLVSKAEAVDEDTIRIANESGNAICPESSGTYTWSLSSSGETLELVREDDDTCAIRGTAIVGTYWRADCSNEDNDCLGKLDSGTYASQFFDPFLANLDDWFRRYGALTYTVPADWVNAGDYPGFFSLAPVGASDGTMIFLASDVVVVSEEDWCQEVPATGVGETAQEIAEWVSGASGIVSTDPMQTTVGGLTAWRLDISLDPGWTESCPFDEGTPGRSLFTDRSAAEGFHWGIGGDGRMRLYLVDLGDGRALMIDIESPTSAEHDAFVDEATTIVESFVFTP